MRKYRGPGFVLLSIVSAVLLFLAVFAEPPDDHALVKRKEWSALYEINQLCMARTAGPSGAARTSGETALGVKNGYRFRLHTTPAGFALHAEPVNYPLTGRRTFYTDQTCVIRENQGSEPATASSPEIGSAAGRKK